MEGQVGTVPVESDDGTEAAPAGGGLVRLTSPDRASADAAVPSFAGRAKARAKKPLVVRILWRALSVVRTGLEVAVIAAALWLFVFQVSVVSGHSMDRSLEPGDRLVVDKLTPRWVSVRRFDVVVFEALDQSGIDYVKRVVGLPGETVELRDGELYIDGERVRQEFDFVRDASLYGPEEVPEGHYFVLGDNRPCSRDSRGFGFVPRKRIKGVARLRVYPFGRAGSVR